MVADTLLVPATLAAGWLGQACFFSRFFVQWLASERARRSIVPRSFWKLSLAGSILMGIYALQQQTMLLLFGFVVSGAVALRNLELGRSRARIDARIAAAAASLLLALSVWIELRTGRTANGSAADIGWLVVAIVGQALWSSRFPVQWWLSERAGVSHLPRAFWWLSLAGNTLLLAYSVHLGNAVFVLGYLPGPLLQLRNLALLRAEPPADAAHEPDARTVAEEAC